MHGAVWRLETHSAHLRSGGLKATLDLLRPSEGLGEVCPAGGVRLTGARLLGVAMAWYWPGESRSCAERYVRGMQLTAAYEEPSERPARVDASWRVLCGKPPDEWIATVELAVSVRTSALECQPELAAESRLSASETLRLRDAESVGYERLTETPQTPLDVNSDEGPGCLLFRLAGTEVSYAEMIHPADFRHSRLWGSSDVAGELCVRHRLFSGRLEKGVILRARVRGVFLPRRRDTQVAAACYSAFGATGPPLSA
jgi:hypothetical protein